MTDRRAFTDPLSTAAAGVGARLLGAATAHDDEVVVSAHDDEVILAQRREEEVGGKLLEAHWRSFASGGGWFPRRSVEAPARVYC